MARKDSGEEKKDLGVGKAALTPAIFANTQLKPVNLAVAAAIGYVAIYWSLLEHMIFSLLGNLVGSTPAVSSALFTEVGFLQRLDMVSSLLHLSRKEDWFSEWKQIDLVINSLRVQRNDAIHGLWGQAINNKHYLVRMKARARVTISTTERDLAEINKLLADIVRVTAHVDAFSNKLKAADVVSAISTPSGTPLDQVQSPKARAQDQARAQKKTRKQADRERSLRRDGAPGKKDGDS